MNGAYGSYDEHERIEVSYDEDGGVEEPCDDSYDDDGEYEESHPTYYENENDLRYSSSSHILYESCDKNTDGAREYSHAFSCGTYPSLSGVSGYVGTSESHLMSKRKCAFPTCRTTMSHASYPNFNVSCSQYGNGVGGRMEGSKGHESRVKSNEPLPVRNLESLRIKELGDAIQKGVDKLIRWVANLKPEELQKMMKMIPHEDEPKEFPLESKQATPCEDNIKGLIMKVKASTFCAPKWKLEVYGSSNPSQGILGTCPNSNKIERRKIERSKGVISDNSRVEKREVVWSDVRELSQSYPNSCNFSCFSSCLDTCAGILGSKPSKTSQNVENQEVLKGFPKEHLCFNVENQSEDNHSYELRGSNSRINPFEKGEDDTIMVSLEHIRRGFYIWMIAWSPEKAMEQQMYKAMGDQDVIWVIKKGPYGLFRK